MKTNWGNSGISVTELSNSLEFLHNFWLHSWLFFADQQEYDVSCFKKNKSFPMKQPAHKKAIENILLLPPVTAHSQFSYKYVVLLCFYSNLIRKSSNNIFPIMHVFYFVWTFATTFTTQIENFQFFWKF